MEVEYEHGEVREVTNNDEMEKLTMDQNIEKFMQAINSPLLNRPLLSKIGTLGI